MKRGRGVRVVVALGLMAIVPPPVARAFPGLANAIPNVVFDTTPSGRRLNCATCHSAVEGGAACVKTGPDDKCLHAFGLDFQSNTNAWDGLQSLDSDGDGYANALELQDLAATWMIGSARPGFAASVTNPGDPTDSPGVDRDGDGFCVVGRDTNGDGVCTGAEIVVTAFDCADDDATAHSGVLEEICTNDVDSDCDGVAPRDEVECEDVRDDDGDGLCPLGEDLDADGACTGAGEPTTTVRDCDDADASVYVGAAEDCFDGVDDDCDGDVDAADAFCSGAMDRDGDGFCPLGRDTDGDGDCLETAATATRADSDCDDLAAAARPGAAEVCGDGLDTDCDGALDEVDPDCARFRDADGDGLCPDGRDRNGDRDCLDPTEAGAGADCDDTNRNRSPDLPENCLPACLVTDEDCDGLADVADPDCLPFRDRDGDGWCPLGRDRLGLRDPCLPPGPPSFAPDGLCLNDGEAGAVGDCNDDAPEERPDGVECDPTGAPCACTNDFDDDCDGRTDARDADCGGYVDRDRDGWCVVGRDTDGDGECTGPGEQGGGGDAAPLDPVIHPDASEHCLDGKDNDQDGDTDLDDLDCTDAMDADGDGYCPVGRDANGNGTCADAGEDRTVSDCDDADPDVHPGLAEDTRPLCTDFRDTDCDTRLDLGDPFGDAYDADPDCDVLLDLDGDGFCTFGLDWNRDGDCVDADEDRGVDCDDTDPAIRQGADERCGNGRDDDCDDATDEADDCVCAADPDCDDADACTADRCEANACVRTPLTDPGCPAAPFVPRRTAGCAAAPTPPPWPSFAALAFLLFVSRYAARRSLRGLATAARRTRR